MEQFFMDETQAGELFYKAGTCGLRASFREVLENGRSVDS
jgi:hypothetical protein